MQNFQAWIEDYGGVDKLAKRLKVTPQAVYTWVKRQGYPKVETMRALVKISKGKLTYVSIIESTKPPHDSNTL